VGQSVVDIAVRGGRALLQLRLEVEGHINELLPDVADDFALGGGHGGRKPNTPRYTLRFDNGPVHDTGKLEQPLEECKFLRLEHPPSSPDLSPFEFFLFGYSPEKMKLLSRETIDKLEEVRTKTIKEIPKGALVSVYYVWRRRSKQCIQNEGNHFE
jgi:hypothetical protein